MFQVINGWFQGWEYLRNFECMYTYAELFPSVTRCFVTIAYLRPLPHKKEICLLSSLKKNAHAVPVR